MTNAIAPARGRKRRILTLDEKLEVASLLARRVPARRIAEQLNMTLGHVETLKYEDPDIAEMIADVKLSAAHATRHLMVTDTVRRVALAQQEVDRIRGVIQARAEEAQARKDDGRPYSPGEEQGILAVKETAVQSGNTVTVTREVKYDSALHAELRGWLKMVRDELTPVDLVIRHTGSVDHNIDLGAKPDLSVLSNEELDQLSAITAKVLAVRDTEGVGHVALQD